MQTNFREENSKLSEREIEVYKSHQFQARADALLGKPAQPV